jgi:hypothetical protein
MSKKEITYKGKVLSGGEIRRKFIELANENPKLKQRAESQFQTLFLLAINLYMIQPKNPIFTNKTFTSDFLAMIEEAVNKKVEAMGKAEKTPEIAPDKPTVADKLALTRDPDEMRMDAQDMQQTMKEHGAGSNNNEDNSAEEIE